jgi:SWIM zinc finger
MSVPPARVSQVTERWDRGRILALAPDAPSTRAAQSLASGRTWPTAGARSGDGAPGTPGALWGECRGSGASPYRTVVDLSGPEYRCSCPSRKSPCKHVLALLLLWADGSVPDDAAGPPDWAGTWLAARAARGVRGAGGVRGGGQPPRERGVPGGRPPGSTRRAEQRETRVASGIAELDRWLCDQARQGLGASQQAGYRHWDDIAARMVDAQAPGLAERLRGLASVPHSGAGWEGRLLEEYALLHLLALAYRRQAELPPPLRATVRSRIGFSLRQADVLACGTPVRDHWQVLARRDLEQDRIRTRRTWLRGRGTGRDALVLSFAPAGQTLDESLPVGTDADADLVFYPGAVPLRAVLLAKHDAAVGVPPAGGTIAGLLACWAAALAADPWLDSWPAVLEVIPVRDPVRAVRDADGDAVPLHPDAGHRWTLFALSGGRPVTVTGEWTPRGLWPLTAWDEAGRIFGAVPL